MANSTIRLTFNSIPTAGETLEILLDVNGTAVLLIETFETKRLEEKQVTIKTTNDLQTVFTAVALDLDYAFFFNITTLTNVMDITLNSSQHTVTSVSGTAVISNDIEVTSIVNPAQIPFMNHTQTIVTRPSPCNSLQIDLVISDGLQPYKFRFDSGDAFLVLGGSTFSFNVARGVNQAYELNDSQTGLELNINKSIAITPRRLVAADFNINIVIAPSGATVTFQLLNTIENLGALTYSLDNITFTSLNSVSGQPADDYTVFIKDRFDCVLPINYTIGSITPDPIEPFFLIPEANSIRYYEDQADTEFIRPNYFNSRSCKEAVDGNAYDATIHFEVTDTGITTQFKTSHSNVALKTTDADGNTTIPTLIKVVTNIGLKDRRDCRFFGASENTIGVYFDAGNTYDPITFAITGTYAQPNGILPFFIDQGVFINVAGLGFKEVVAIEFDSTRMVWYAVVDGSVTGADVSAICATTFNAQPYDVYEFTIDMSTFLNKQFKIEITTSLVTWRSEVIQVTTLVPGLVIQYQHSQNAANMVYATGISNLLRLPQADMPKLQVETDISVYKSDEAPIQLDAKLYKEFEIRAELLTTAMAFKLSIALTHNIVTINGLSMTIKEISQFEVIEGTNLYNVRIVMMEGGNELIKIREEQINLQTLGAIRLEAVGFLSYSL